MTYVFDPDKVIIEEPTVPLARKEDDDYIWRRKEIESDLRMSNAMEKLCTHEAGHIIYMERAGLPKPSFFGPTITFDGKKFQHCTIGVKPFDLGSYHRTGKSMVRLARAMAAGGVFLEVLFNCPRDKNGDSGDYALFEAECKKFYRDDLTRIYNPPKRWTQARSKVRKDLEKNIIKEDAIERTKEEVMRECFPMVL